MSYIGIDIGTTTLCAVCLDEGGRVLYSSTMPNSSCLEGMPYEALQSPRDILNSCGKLIAEISGRFPDIAAIGISNQMHGILYVDDKGNAISPLYTWQDERGNLLYTDTETYCMRLSQLTGYSMATGFGLTTHYYNCLNSAVPDGASKLCTIGDYVAMQLCDSHVNKKQPRMHPSNAASLGLFNLAANRFDAEALRKADINPAILPDITQGEEPVGRTRSGILVCAAVGDNQASVFGSLSGDSAIHINIGTSSQISLVTDSIIKSAAMECRPYFWGKYLLVGSPLCGGYSYHMLKSFFEESAGMLGITQVDDIYDKMNKAGLEAYCLGKEGLSVDTRFRGTRAEPHLRGSITGISPSSFKPGNLIVALLRGICEELYACFDPIAGSHQGNAPICASGNGVRLNPLLVRLLEETFNRSIIIPVYREEASAGAAKAAMLTVNRIR